LDPILEKITELYFKTQEQVGALTQKIASLEARIQECEFNAKVAKDLVLLDQASPTDVFGTTEIPETSVQSEADSGNMVSMSSRRQYYDRLAKGEGQKAN